MYEIQNEKLSYLLGKLPSWIIRWGSVIVFVILLVSLILSNFIKFPDTISSEFLLTTKIVPATVVTRTSGNIHLFVEDNQIVTKGEVIGVIENSANVYDVISLEEFLKSFGKIVFNDSVDLSNIILPKDYIVGDIQLAYHNFNDALREYQILLGLDAYKNKIQNLKSQIEEFEYLNDVLQQQIEIHREIYELGESKMNREERMFKDQVLSEQDYENALNQLLGLKNNIQASLANKSANSIQISKLKGAIIDLRIEYKENLIVKREKITTTYFTLMNQINNWKQDFAFISPINGTIDISRFWSNSQHANSGDEVLRIIPSKQEILGITFVPLKGTSKLNIGQTVYVDLDNYNSAEIGRIRGEVKDISSIPVEGKYRVTIILPDNLMTEYNNQLIFKPEMTGRAEIVTESTTVFDRLFNKFKGLKSKF